MSRHVTCCLLTPKPAHNLWESRHPSPAPGATPPMRIKRLDITGFKSFMDRSFFAFGDGITGVVGPNG